MPVAFCFYGLEVFSFYLESFFWCASYYRPRLFSVGVPLRGRFALRLWWLTARFPRLAARGTRALRFIHHTSKDGSAVATSSKGRLQSSACGRAADRRRVHMYRSREPHSGCTDALAVRKRSGSARAAPMRQPTRLLELASRDTLGLQPAISEIGHNAL